MKDISTSPVGSWRAAPDVTLKDIDRWYSEKRVARALEGLNDATLRDIGIYRCEIPWFARNRCAADET